MCVGVEIFNFQLLMCRLFSNFRANLKTDEMIFAKEKYHKKLIDEYDLNDSAIIVICSHTYEKKTFKIYEIENIKIFGCTINLSLRILRTNRSIH